MSPEQIELVYELFRIEREQAKLKKREMEIRTQLRLEVFAHVGPDDEGTYRADVQEHGGEMVRLKLSAKRNYKVDAAKVHDVLNAIEATIPNGAVLHEQVIKWAPTLSLSGMKQAPDDVMRLLLPVISWKPAPPSFEIELPKPKEI